MLCTASDCLITVALWKKKPELEIINHMRRTQKFSHNETGKVCGQVNTNFYGGNLITLSVVFITVFYTKDRGNVSRY